MAIRFETEACEFYNHAAEIAHDPSAKVLLKEFASIVRIKLGVFGLNTKKKAVLGSQSEPWVVEDRVVQSRQATPVAPAP